MFLKSSALGYYLAFAYFFANFSLVLHITVLLIKLKACTGKYGLEKNSVFGHFSRSVGTVIGKQVFCEIAAET